ncbi:probable N-acetyl-LL-diaminopimelate aminotransferase [Schistocerca gregaria]|uniref:probable N-acetyl-LL-diaminopimelate aminotransferase n=1 Tax=Schistocerca gregaria TaxID=7010 RepID=UPI00211E62AC|nr:probable N-acetyl-LL-diaminopimelate aminotransferase [Schistocerca gregaria]XP_049848512.1 probable N-acetyl-LL-diaminopimelate aminotransferase [Schistocerca gregaria]XP_049848513.1 probable N-acetyl-LL-diaminopimelate aminotransferase [Schistocerca gregaria]XP_049848514.1 probable N-acetyl-LL-diaminopimelate aminotransferase [Schistocerca gregaria]XP_049848515.1 probable N-acetyl-LL-diaminopimelate aminotransferase [Schistocerca gregaria]XP_049848516.1 probable N-acetyl-LL-diaminopimelat
MSSEEEKTQRVEIESQSEKLLSQGTQVVPRKPILVKKNQENESTPHLRLRAAMSRATIELVRTPGFEDSASTGVIYVMSRATMLGWGYKNREWCNFGQGAPEVGQIPNSVPRPTSASWNPQGNEYASVAGTKKLRQAVADLYNVRYRVGLKSQYTYENVCITPGGRASLTRLASTFGQVYLGHFLPDYSAYEEMLSVFKKFVPIPEMLDPLLDYKERIANLHREIVAKGLSLVLLSNPSNPTGNVIEETELDEWVQLARDTHTCFIMDEFYSNYIYSHPVEQNGRTVSAASYVHDVNSDPIVIVNGLTKNWRLPGWRITWTIGPKDVIRNVANAGSFLDGGANHPFQEAAIPLLDPKFVHEDTKCLQDHFRKKRDYVASELINMGIDIPKISKGTFYLWADVRNLPPPLNMGLGFFEEALKFKVVVVPGIFFDVNPAKRRNLFHSPYHHNVRISYGPPMEELALGLKNLREMIHKYTKK